MDQANTSWTSDELSRIEEEQELEIAPWRRDGTLRKFVPIWVVRVDGDAYVRAAYGPGSGWHRVARTSRAARIRAGGVEKDVSIEEEVGRSTAATRTSSMASPTPRHAPPRSGSCRTRS